MNSRNQSKRKILFLSWRDIKHPKKGGAEVYTHEVLKRLVERGMEIEHYSVLFDDGVREEFIDGVRYIRSGNNATVIIHAMAHYFRHQSEIALVVDQCNTHRFFTSWWIPHSKRVFFIHQLTREIWQQMYPGTKGQVGNVMETLMLKMNRHDNTITVSESTRCDLLSVGFDPKRVVIAPEGLVFEPWSPEDFCEKEGNTLLYAGRINPYKGVEVCIQALAKLRAEGRNTRLWVVGKGDPEYINNRLKPLIESLGLNYSEGMGDPRTHDVHFFGFVSSYDLKNLMSRSKALLFASQREGWGLTVSESAIVGTPSVVWPSQGLIDAVHFGRAGYLCAKKDVDSMVEQIGRIFDDPDEYQKIRMDAYEFACTLSFNRSADVFESCLKQLLPN
jgi:glycosyltransferase involved in cell wall biosynthesis